MIRVTIGGIVGIAVGRSAARPLGEARVHWWHIVAGAVMAAVTAVTLGRVAVVVVVVVVTALVERLGLGHVRHMVRVSSHVRALWRP